MIKRATVLALAAALAAPAMAQTIEDCGDIAADNDRLACYDAFVGSAAQAPPAGESEVIEFSGSGARTLAPIEISGPWTFEWEAQGGFFHANFEDPTNQRASLDLMRYGPISQDTQGETYVPTGGNIMITIQAMGPWSFRIEPAD